MIKKIASLCIVMLVTFATHAQVKSRHTFALGDSVFLLDGKPFHMISGEMHYARVPRAAWRARMKMAKAMGLNTIGTYILWNLHEPEKGKFNFSNENDIASFVKIAQEEGLWVILRPSPYVCAEWEFGGYPYWLQNEKGLEVRSKEAQYLEEYRKYINEIGKQLAPYQINHGGNILMVQIENEYGSYGSDKVYLETNRQMFVDAGFNGLLYTCDPAADLVKGHLPGLLPAVNGLDKPSQVKKIINDNHNGKGPYYIAEWYPAWFDWWGAPHHTVPADKYAPSLDSVLGAGISINMYMFHGGTTRGFMNGANFKDSTPFEPQISSYDYDAPLDEAGNATPKYMSFRKVIEKHLALGQSLPPVPAAKPAIKIPEFKLTRSVSLFRMLPKAVLSDTLLTFEALQQDYGFVLYTTKIDIDQPSVLKIPAVRDYAVICLDGKRIGTIDRRLKQDSIMIPAGKAKATLQILVENLGRINFGKYLLQNNKGILGKVMLDGKTLSGWRIYKLPFSTMPVVQQQDVMESQGPVIKSGTFHISRPADTYLDMSAWGKGVIWVNGHNIGRYWNIGPQQSLYVPTEWLKAGTNTVVVFDLLSSRSLLSSAERPVLNKLN